MVNIDSPEKDGEDIEVHVPTKQQDSSQDDVIKDEDLASPSVVDDKDKRQYSS